MTIASVVPPKPLRDAADVWDHVPDPERRRGSVEGDRGAVRAVAKMGDRVG